MCYYHLYSSESQAIIVVLKKRLIVSKELCSCSDKIETISKEGLNKVDSHDLSLYLLLLNTAVVIITVRDKANQTAIIVKWGLVLN